MKANLRRYHNTGLNTWKEDENRFWAGKRVEYSQYLPLIREGKYESVPADFFISGRMENEQSVEVQQTHHVTMVSENSIVPVDVLF